MVLFDTYSPNYRELDKSRHDENYYSRRNRELSNPLLRRDLLFSFLFLSFCADFLEN